VWADRKSSFFYPKFDSDLGKTAESVDLGTPSANDCRAIKPSASTREFCSQIGGVVTKTALRNLTP